VKRVCRAADLAALAGIVALALALLAPGRAAGELRLSFLDIGQGDSILIEAPNGASAMVDGGPPGSVLPPLAAALPAGRAIAAAIATHPDLDHIGGLPSVVSKRKVEKLLSSPYKSGEPTERALDVAVTDANVATGTLIRGDRLVLDEADGVFLDILWPPPNLPAAAGNNMSMVAVLRYGSSSALLTGDAPKGVEKILVAAGDPLDVQILKPGHHGSKTATDSAFVVAASPLFAVISAGISNRYGHPTAETLVTLAEAHVAIESTLGRGTVAFSTKGDGRWEMLPQG